MNKDEAMKLAQDACPYFDERLQGAFYVGVITALDYFPDTTKMIDTATDRGTWDEFGNSGMQYPEECDLIGGETDCVEEPPNSTTDVVEPVAWIVHEDGVRGLHWSHPRNGMIKTEPLYTAPTKRKWVGLNNVEIGRLTVFDGLHHVDTLVLADFIRAIEAKLKEKNHG